jgi:hypothetical protein
MEWVSCKEQNLLKKVKFPAHRAGLPGKVISFYIVPLDPAYKAGLAGHVPANRNLVEITPFPGLSDSLSRRVRYPSISE